MDTDIYQGFNLKKAYVLLEDCRNVASAHIERNVSYDTETAEGLNSQEEMDTDSQDMSRDEETEKQNSTMEINTFNMSEEEKLKCLEELRKEHKGAEICMLCKKRKPTGAHLMMHLGLKQPKCTVCKKTYLSKSGLEQHSCTGKKPAADKWKTYWCRECDSVLSSTTTLRAHMKRHESPKHNCYTCERKFAHKYELDHHMKYHESERPFGCEQCPKSFKTKKDLGRHSIVHLEEFRYKCIDCDEVFKHPNSLKLHRQKHLENPKPFTCEICNKSFAVKSILNNHVATHGTKNIDCTHCDKTFKTERLLKAHLKRNSVEFISCSF